MADRSLDQRVAREIQLRRMGHDLIPQLPKDTAEAVRVLRFMLAQVEGNLDPERIAQELLAEQRDQDRQPRRARYPSLACSN